MLLQLQLEPGGSSLDRTNKPKNKFFSLHCSVIKSFSVSNRAKEAFTNEMSFLHMERDDKGSSFCLMLMLNVP